MFDRPPVERYARTSVEVCGVTVEPGLELREGDDFEQLIRSLEVLVLMVPGGKEVADYATDIGKAVALRWPDRAYFVEVHGAAGWIQIFQPFGVPRNK